MERLNEQQIEIIKKYEGNINPIDLERYQVGISESDYEDLTGIDLKTLDRMFGTTKVSYAVRYCKCGEHFELQYATFIYDSIKDELSGAFECDDFLELFSTKQTEDIHEKLQELFENHFNEFEDFLKEKDYIRKEDITEDDVNDSLKEDIACTYIEYNPSECCEKALDSMDNSDLADVAKDIIDRLY